MRLPAALPVLALLMAVFAASPAWAAPDSPHLAAHRELNRKFTAMLATDPASAMRFAKDAVASTKLLGPYDQKRADALELVARAHIYAEEWQQAMPLTAEVLLIRRAERPPEPEILSLALMNHALVLFGAERQAEADAALTEVVEIWRKAFGERDLRRAEKLEQYATLVQGGFGRTAWAAELLREALDVRKWHPPDTRLAITLYDLAEQELLLQEAGNADAHLARASDLSEKELARKRDNEDMWARQVQVLLARAGISASLGNQAQALKFIEAARTHRFKERALRAEMGIRVAMVHAEVIRRSGDIDGAITAQTVALDILNHSQDLFDSRALSELLAYDVLVGLGRLYLAVPELELARQAFDLARKRAGGEDTALLFLLAELEQASGNGPAAMKHYQAALQSRKESAGEATVLYGTNRRLPRNAAQGMFGGEASTVLSFGRAEVLVPGAGYSQKSLLPPLRAEAIPFGRATDAETLLIRDRHSLQRDEFAAVASGMARRAKLYEGSALVFVHGFNVTFDQALQRAAQLKRDLNYDSALFVFSWPSKGSMREYGTDRRTADAAVASLVEFLAEVERSTGAAKIHLIAHSMGNRVLLPALAQIAEKPPETLGANKIGEVILAAPAVPRPEFVRWIDRMAAGGIDHLTLYASATDMAMWGGVYEEGTVLAGYAPHGRILRHAPVQSIDLTLAGLPGLRELNHDVFASNPVMTDDMRQLLQHSPRKSPEQRLPLMRCRDGQPGSLRYWVYDPAAGALSTCKT